MKEEKQNKQKQKKQLLNLHLNSTVYDTWKTEMIFAIFVDSSQVENYGIKWVNTVGKCCVLCICWKICSVVFVDWGWTVE